MSWKSELEDLFDIFVHQNSLEYAADHMADYAYEDIKAHKKYLYLLETAIANCREEETDAMAAINNGTGYNPQSIEETLRLLTELYELYLQGYKNHGS
jgi:hypothetical protein